MAVVRMDAPPSQMHALTHTPTLAGLQSLIYDHLLQL